MEEEGRGKKRGGKRSKGRGRVKGEESGKGEGRERGERERVRRVGGREEQEKGQ